MLHFRLYSFRLELLRIIWGNCQFLSFPPKHSYFILELFLLWSISKCSVCLTIKGLTVCCAWPGLHYGKESVRSSGGGDLHNFISSGFVTLGRGHQKGKLLLLSSSDATAETLHLLIPRCVAPATPATNNDTLDDMFSDRLSFPQQFTGASAFCN